MIFFISAKAARKMSVKLAPGVISKQGMLEDEVCVYEIVRQKGEKTTPFVLCKKTFHSLK